MTDPLGVIHDTNSHGRFDLVVYDDGILAMHGTYVGVTLRGGGVGLGAGSGSASGAGLGAAAGSSAGQSYEDRRTAEHLAEGREALLAADNRAFFMERASFARLRLRKRWHEHRLTIESTTGDTRVFAWKPALNRFAAVEGALDDAFGPLVVRE